MRQVMLAAEEVVAPRLRDAVERAMRTVQAELDAVGHADPDPDDDEGFRRYALALQRHVSKDSATFISQNVPTDRQSRDQYRTMPAWERTAALFINFPNMVLDGVQHWDITALCACVQDCAAFDATQRKAALSLRGVRNTVEPKNVCVSSDDAYYALLDRLGGALHNLGVSEAAAKEMLQPYRDGMKRCMPARSTLAEALQYAKEGREGVLKLMTSEQHAGFRLLREADRPSTQLIEAPAGSGKTLMAVKLVADNLREQLSLG